MRILQLIIVFLFSIQLYSSNGINDIYVDYTIYEKFKINEYNNTYKSKIKVIKDNIVMFLTKLSLFYENENMIIFFVKNYNKDIGMLYEFVFKNHLINALKILIKYNKYYYNDFLFHYKILLFNNKTNWKNKLLNN